MLLVALIAGTWCRYLFNHKCATCDEIDDSNDTVEGNGGEFNNTRCSMCDTPDSSGFSYMVGYVTLPTTTLRGCLLYTSPSPRDRQKSRMPSSA